MADSQLGSTQSEDMRPGSSAWRKRIAVLVAVALAAAGLLLLERGPSASAAATPKVTASALKAAAVSSGSVSSASASSASASSAKDTVAAQVAHIKAVTTQLQGAASVMAQTLPDLDSATAATTADLAASTKNAATLSQRLATITASRHIDPAAAASTASALQSALAATQARSTRIPITLPIRFCNFTIQIGPIIINIPRLHIHIVIGPFFIHFRAPCFLSGIIPTHVP